MGEQRVKRPYYTITCKIDGNKFPVEISKVEFRNTITSPIQSILIWMRSNTEDWVIHDLLGKHDLKLNVKYMTETTQPREEIDLDLIIIKVEYPLSQKQDKKISPHGEDLLILHTVVKQPYNMLKTRVNEIFEIGSNKTPFEIVGAVKSKFLQGINEYIIPANSNPDKMWQFLVPPMNFIDSVRYVDGADKEVSAEFGPGVGIYKGPAFYHCRWEENTFCMWDLKNAIQSKPEDYKVYLLNEGSKDHDIFVKSGIDDKAYHTYAQVRSVHRANQDLIQNAFYNNFLSKPKNYLYSWQALNAQ